MQKGTLHTILSALVSDFGYQKVRKSLDGFSGTETGINESGKSLSGSSSKSRARRNAVSFVDAMRVEDRDKREILLVLAREFEGKKFIPNVNSARAFLEQQGKDSSRIKSRQQVVSTILKCLANLETHVLCEMHDKGLFGDPKSLGVIAESIERAGQRSRL